MPVRQKVASRGEENLKNSCFEKGFRDWETPEKPIFEVPKFDGQPAEIAKVVFPWVKKVKIQYFSTFIYW